MRSVKPESARLAFGQLGGPIREPFRAATTRAFEVRCWIASAHCPEVAPVGALAAQVELDPTAHGCDSVGEKRS